MVFQLVRRRRRDLEEPRELATPIASAAFGDVGADRDGGAAELREEGVIAPSRRPLRGAVDVERQGMGQSPDTKGVVVLHRKSAESSPESGAVPCRAPNRHLARSYISPRR